MENKYLTITAITRYLKHKFEIDDNLKTVYLKGEISNFKAHTTGHLYFSLKDETSKINAIMFKNNALNLKFEPKEGMKVTVTGSIRVYEASGGYQIYVNQMEEDGFGNLYLEFLKRKEKLEKEGLFDLKYKKKIPKFPKKIGIVTAKTGAAIRDILSTIERRYPLCETYLFPTLVQGDNASIDIKNKIEQASSYDFDVLIVGRGGGSFEDLNAFNDEGVARAIFNSEIPIISAVGHEIDFTIADFVADLRAPTPTGAAEMAVPNLIDVKTNLNQLTIRGKESIQKKLKILNLQLDKCKNSFLVKNPELLFQSKRQTVDLYQEKCFRLLQDKLKNLRNILARYQMNYIINNPKVLYEKQRKQWLNLTEKLELVNPLSLLKKGYSLTVKDNVVITSIKKIKKDDNITVNLSDGSINCIVKEKTKKEGK